LAIGHDEPHTRIESSATAGSFIARPLRELGQLGGEYTEMIHRAFLGLKTLYYRGDLRHLVGGTATGTDNYYRTRPMAV